MCLLFIIDAVKYLIYDKRAKANRGNIAKSADVPTESLSYLLDDDKRGYARADKKHIYRSLRRFPKNAVYCKGNAAE